MKADHFEILVEEPSSEAFLREVLPKILGEEISFDIRVFQGKYDLLAQIGSRLRGYSRWLPFNSRIVVLVDRDQADCRALKQQLEAAAAAANLSTRSNIRDGEWQVVNRIVVEELEAWFFGEWKSVVSAFPRMSSSISRQAAYRNCDAIAGGTWEAFERLLMSRGYFSGGLRKVEAARAVGVEFSPDQCSSTSFQRFREALIEATNR